MNTMSQEHHLGTMRLFKLLFHFRKLSVSDAMCDRLSPGEMAMMCALNAYDGQLKKEVLPICELSQRLNTTQPAVTQLVNRLEAKGLVRRKASQADRRTVLVETTASGTRTFKKEYESALELADEIIARMGDEKSDAFFALLEDFMDCAREVLMQRNRHV
jgi:DNA-binding MarR family transcriptional regulator